MSDKIKEQCNLMKNEANMYRQELDKTKAKVDYKELIARDVTAQRIIDNHNKELMQRQYDITNTGHICNIICTSLNNRNLQSREETRSISKSNKIYITELSRISNEKICLNSRPTKNTRRTMSTRDNNRLKEHK